MRRRSAPPSSRSFPGLDESGETWGSTGRPGSGSSSARPGRVRGALTIGRMGSSSSWTRRSPTSLPGWRGNMPALRPRYRPAETVWDLCCGIGPFALTLARRGLAERIVAVDSNPAAIALLRENAERLRVAGRIEARNESVEQFLKADRDRGPASCSTFPTKELSPFPSVSAAVAPGGTVHYYEVTPRADHSMRGIALVRQLGSGADWTCLESRLVHPYSPQANLVAYTFRRT